MISLGRWQDLPVIQIENFGVYLGSAEEKVLLPKKQVPENTRPGDVLNVFVYKDSEDRLISTINKPKIEMGEIAVLKVKELTKIGAFLDWGLEKDLFMPFSQHIGEVRANRYYPVALYEDKSNRLCATMWTDKYIKAGSVDEKTKAKAMIKMQADTENVCEIIKEKGGRINYNDKADPKIIEADFGISKNAFKKAVGILYKNRRIDIKEDGIELI